MQVFQELIRSIQRTQAELVLAIEEKQRETERFVEEVLQYPSCSVPCIRFYLTKRVPGANIMVSDLRVNAYKVVPGPDRGAGTGDH
jgi:hypothetical protein